MSGAARSLGLNRTVVSLSVARLADGIGNSILFIMIPLYVAALPERSVPLPLPILVGVLISTYGLAAAVLQPLVALVSDRIGRFKRMIQAGLGLLALATLGFLYAGSYLDLLGLRFIQGAGLAMEIPPAMALLAVFTEKRTRGSAMGFYTTLRMVGVALGPVLAGFLHARFGFAAAFLAGAAVLAVAALVVEFGVDDPPAVPGRARRASGIDLSLLSPGVLSAALATFLMASAFTLVTTLENEFNARLQIDAFGFSLAFSSLLVGRLLFQVPLGKLSDRVGRRPLVLAGLLLIAPATALLGEVGDLTTFILVRFGQGIAAAAIVAPALALAGDLSYTVEEDRRSQLMSIVTTGFGLGIAFGPLLAGFLSVVSFRLPFLADGILCLLGAGVAYRYLPETVGRDRFPPPGQVEG